MLDLTLPYICHIEYANADANIVEDVIRVFLVQLDEWGSK
jgi:hypothetical protein